MATQNTDVCAYLIKHPESFLYRDFIIEVFAHVDRLEITETNGTATVTTEAALYVGKLAAHGGYLFRIESYSLVSKDDDDASTYSVTVSPTGIKIPKDNLLCTPTDVMYIQNGDIANYTGEHTLETSVGLFFLNYMTLARPFGNVVPYRNTIWKSGSLQSELGDLLINQKITVDQIKESQNNTFFYGQMTEVFAPNLTKKSLSTDPKIPEIKKKLLEENAEALAKGDSVAMSGIESKLIAVDKEYLKDDPASLFLIKSKYWNVVRKKLFLTHGMVERFGAKGVFDFVPNSLEEGWTQQSIPVIFNETRSGSYSRAMETADGGARAKEILRVFQNTRVVEEDCGATKGLTVLFAPYNSADYIYRYALVGGKVVEITKENHRSFEGKAVSVRSPQYCKTQNGLCYTCVGKLFQSLGQDGFATVVQSLASAFLNASLKRMHGVNIGVYVINNLDDYIVTGK